MQPEPPATVAEAAAPTATATGPVRRGGFPTKWVLVGCGGCGVLIVLAVLFFGGVFALAMNLSAPGRDAGDKFMSALRDGDYQQAYRLGTPNLQRQYGSAAALQRDIEGNKVQPRGWSFSSTNLSGDTGQVSGNVTFTDGSKGSVAIQLAKDGGAWKIDDFDLSG